MHRRVRRKDHPATAQPVIDEVNRDPLKDAIGHSPYPQIQYTATAAKKQAPDMLAMRSKALRSGRLRVMRIHHHFAMKWSAT